MDCDDVVRYGIAKCNGIVTLIQEPRSSETLFLGTLVRIVQQLSNMYLAIQVCDTEHRPNVWKDTIWFCPLENILPVASELWQIILAISSPLDRVNLVQSPDFCYYLKHEIKVNDYTYAQHNDQKIKCLVKSIGPAKHVGPGTYFELQPLDVNKDDNQRPFECLFVAANKLIKPTTADQHKNHIESFNQIMNDEKYLNKKSNKGSNLIDVSKKRHPFQSTLKSSSSSSSSSTCSASSLSNVAKRFTHPENHDDQIRLLKDIQQTHLSDPPNHRQKHTVNKNDSSRNGRKEDAKYVLEFGNSNKRDQSIDLMEVLIGDWPKNVPILSEKNKSKCYNDTMDQVKHERNKSANPISHLLHKNKSVNHKHSEHLSTGFEVNDSKKSNNLDPPNLKISGFHSPLYDTPERQLSPTITNDKSSINDSCPFEIGSLVEVTTDLNESLYGVLRWISPRYPQIVGVELEEEHTNLPIDLTDGTYKSKRYFNCAPGRALFVPIEQIQLDARFRLLENYESNDETDDRHVVPSTINGLSQMRSLCDSKMFGQIECPVIEGAVPPLCMQSDFQVEEMCGKNRGIQGHHNSCYLDATLFAMFACSAVFDSLLFRPPSPQNDIEQYEQVQKVLREEIVNPLRKNLYVRADRVMKLRTLLEKLGSVTGLTSEEKDPEEFLNSLLAQILRAEPFLKLSSGQEAFYYQLFVEKDERLMLPSVQQLFEQSFLASNIKLKEVPSCLIIQMPRFGKSYKMYPKIIPSLVLDITDIIEDSPRQCTVCGKLAQYECVQCFDPCGEGLEGTAFCMQCRDRTHNENSGRQNHRSTPLKVPADFQMMAEHCPPPRLFMELFAVVCIETSHYVAFVKCGSGHEAPWCFFDSMADRKGEQNGYNIPEIVSCSGLAQWLADDVGTLLSRSPQMPEPARRLLCDAYLCLYQSSDVMMYR